MAIAIFYTDSSDAKVAYEIHKALGEVPYDELSRFRQQLLDVVRDNATEVFDHSKEAGNE